MGLEQFHVGEMRKSFHISKRSDLAETRRKLGKRRCGLMILCEDGVEEHEDLRRSGWEWNRHVDS